ncbi:cytochrome d ubiquinol oxidase subunit II [Falsochrobactrum shanghaiense]|uniref:cytochrome d ubiquinol oxidase subunit II n=1 Tax=Falsochrobactrum shanghaiense TaxID=2201899 RepID=UPI002477D2D6|nr:cytochrome d ubiquinol oxidase subunit II [Falsochrobactrum shanghaiense]
MILSALYLPLMMMLAGLIWRGVAFEFRFKADEAHKPFWDKAFMWGSYIATFSQGLALGAFINGFKVSDGTYAGGFFDWLSPFSLFTGFALLIGYALLGVTWLIMKTEGALQQRMRALGRPITLVVLAAIIIVSLWTPFAHADIAARWFSLPNLYFLAPVPVLVVLATWALFKCMDGENHAAPFFLALFLLFLGYTGFGISLWPNIIPPAISIWDAAAPPQSMGFTLVGALFIIPFILAYPIQGYAGNVVVGDEVHLRADVSSC